MDIKTIQTEADYKAALFEIDGMGDPFPGTSEYARLDSLVTLVEDFEAVHCPIILPSAEAMAEYEAEKRGLIYEKSA